MNHELAKAIETVGTRADLARMLKVSRQAIRNWERQSYVPPMRAKEIAKLTGVDRFALIRPELRAVFKALNTKR